MRALTLCIVAVLLASAAADAQISVRPGQYEYTMELNLGGRDGKEFVDAVLKEAGSARDASKSTFLQCITPEDVKSMQDPNSIIKLFAREIDDDGCTISDVKTSENKLSYALACVEDNTRMTMTTEMTFSADTMIGISKGSMDGKPLSTAIVAKRVGDCSK